MGMADGPTNSRSGSSALSRSKFEARPRAHSWRKMYEPLAWTASTTYETERSGRELLVGVNNAHLLPGLDLRIGVDVRSMEPCPGHRVDDSSLGYQK